MGYTGRKFQGILADICDDERRHFQTTLAEGRSAADTERNNRNEDLTSNIKGEIVRIINYDFENETITIASCDIEQEEKDEEI